jgi:hypothetical protein
LLEQLEAREPISELKESAIDLGFDLAANGEPEVQVEREVVDGAYLSGRERRDLDRATPWRIRIAIRNAAVGVHAFPPRVEIEEIAHDHGDADQIERFEFEGNLPDHLPLRLAPRKLPVELQVPRRIADRGVLERSDDDRIMQATTIFGADNRYLFNDTAYPWCTVGRVDTPGGSASGTMVGPRHVLTCSHTIQWNADNTAGWVKFTPAYFDGSTPFGVAWGIRVYWEGLVYGPPSITRRRPARLRLRRPRPKHRQPDRLDGIAELVRRLGRPCRLASHRIPGRSRQRRAAVVPGRHLARWLILGPRGTYADLPPRRRLARSVGRPVLRVVVRRVLPARFADQSGQDSDENTASGGAHMVNCIIRARNDYP